MDEDTPSSEISSIDISTAEQCTYESFFEPGEKDSLQCSNPKCVRRVHFECSQLPPYPAQIHWNTQQNAKRKSTFVCCHCVDVSDDVLLLCKSNEEQLKNLIKEQD